MDNLDSSNSSYDSDCSMCSEAKTFQDGTATSVSLDYALEQFLTAKPRHHESIKTFKLMLETYGYECECEPKDHKLHSVDSILGNANYFLTWFLVRKCLSTSKSNKKAATCMSVLIKFCIEQKWIENDERAIDELKTIAIICKFDGQALNKSLQQLHKEDYWKKLVKGDGFKEDNVTDSIDTDMHIKITEVCKDGWFMGEGDWFMGVDYERSEDDAFMSLPPEIAKKGLVGVGFSCMSIMCCDGVWIPYESYGRDRICANVYPPQ